MLEPGTPGSPDHGTLQWFHYRISYLSRNLTVLNCHISDVGKIFTAANMQIFDPACVELVINENEHLSLRPGYINRKDTSQTTIMDNPYRSSHYSHQRYTEAQDQIAGVCHSEYSR